MPPDVAVVIATRNRPDAVRDVVRDLADQAPHALVVIDQSDPALQAPDLGAVHRPMAPLGLPAARNAGIRATTAPIVLFLDDDVRLRPGVVAGHAEAYADPRVGGVSGRIVERRVLPTAPAVTNRVDARGRARTNLEGEHVRRLELLKGAHMSFRRQALEQVGGFDVAFRGTAYMEDADAAERVRRAGWRLAFAPSAVVEHLSLPVGGVRLPPREVEWWRFHNTALFLRRHRGAWGPLPGLGRFAAVAARRATAWRDPSAAAWLLDAYRLGWAEGALPGPSPDALAR